MNTQDVTNLREGAVVPDVTVVGETVANETQPTLLDVLLDGIERLLLGDLEFGVGPTGDLDNHVEDAIALVGKERNVVEGGDDGSVLFWVNAMFWGEFVRGWMSARLSETYRRCWAHRRHGSRILGG